MTSQRNDRVIYSEVSYLLLGIIGDSILFDPTDWGLNPTRISTAVHRGYLCEYGIVEDRVVLMNVSIRVKSGNCPVIGTTVPRSSGDATLFEYERPDVQIRHTGSLLIGRVTDKAWWRTGFVEAVHAENLIELVCVNGHLDRAIHNPTDTERFDNYWTKHVGIATSLPLRDEFKLAPLPLRTGDTNR